MFLKRGQAAMEFLMTYGWAILIVLIALGALFYLGVFNPKAQNTCTSPISGISCIGGDVKVAGAARTVDVVLGATGTSSATVGAITLDVGGTAFTCTAPPDTAISTTTATKKTYTACIAGSTPLAGTDAKKKFSGTIAITYRLQGSTIDHDDKIQISGTVE